MLFVRILMCNSLRGLQEVFVMFRGVEYLITTKRQSYIVNAKRSWQVMCESSFLPLNEGLSANSY